MVAPQDYDVRQPGRVLELQNSDLWLRPTDLSWQFHILMTIREEPFKNYCSRTAEKWKAKFQEAQKQKIKKNDELIRRLAHQVKNHPNKDAVIAVLQNNRTYNSLQ